MQKYYGDDEPAAVKAPGRWGLTMAGRRRATEATVATVDDPNDELCRICLQGVRSKSMAISCFVLPH